MVQNYTKRGRHHCSISAIRKKNSKTLQRDDNCYFKHINIQLTPTLKMIVGLVFFAGINFFILFLLSGPTNINRIGTFKTFLLTRVATYCSLFNKLTSIFIRLSSY